MSEGVRSPFGKLLRAYRQQRGLSQAGLADLITQRNLSDPEFARLGVVTEKAIANLESASRPPSRWVRPRPQTVSLFLAALEILPGTREEQAFLDAAEEARNREQQTTIARRPNVFVAEGRESQLRQLTAAWATARAGQPEFVLIAGDAGTGKTRLIQHLAETVRTQDPSALIVIGECTPGANAIEPYQPFLHAFNQMLGLATNEIVNDADAQVRDTQMITTALTLAPGLIGPLVNESALSERIKEMGEQGQELSEIAARYRALHSPIEISTRLDQTVRFVTRAAEIQPLVIVVEDLHWADQRTCTLLIHLQRELMHRTDAPILVIGSYRSSDLLPDDAGDLHPLRATIAEMMRRSNEPVIDLSGTIGGVNGGRFVGGLLREMGIDEIAAKGLGDFLFERTQGHPLFSVELFRWLRDRRQLQKEPDGSWKPASSVLMNNIPHEVLAMVAERIERFPPHLRRILSIAAAQGQNFSVEILTSAASLSEEDMATIIDDELVAHHRLLIPTGTETLAGQTIHRYSFSHAMFQEYLYHSLSGPERKRIHSMIAEAIVDVLGIENNAAAGETALHFWKAEKFQEAGFYAYMAGARATQQTEYDLANDWFERSIEYASRAKDMARVGRSRNGIALLKRRTGQFDEGIRIANQVLEEAKQRGYANLEGECHTQLGQFYYDLSESDIAERHLRRAADIYRSLDNRFGLSGVESMLSHTAYRKGRYDNALAHARIAGQLSAELNNNDFAAEALLAAGNCEVDLGMYQKAIDTYQQAVTYYRSAADHRGELLCTLNSGLANVQIGEYDEAILILNRAMDLVMRRRLDRYVPFVANYLGLAFEGKGDLGRAAEHFRIARDRRRDSGLGGLAQDNVAGLLRIATVRKDRSAMLMHSRELEDWLSKQGASGLEDPLLAYLSLAVAQEALGETEQSHATIRTGYELLMERANLLTDPETVRNYLEGVPTNQKLRLRYAALNEKRAPRMLHTLQEARESGIAAP